MKSTRHVGVRAAAIAVFLVAALAVLPSCSIFSDHESDYYDYAGRLFDQHDYSKAAFFYKELVTNYPNGRYARSALYDLGSIYFLHLGDTSRAVFYLKLFIDKMAEPSRTKTDYVNFEDAVDMIVMSFAKQGRREKAIQIIAHNKRIFDDLGKQDKYYYLIGEIYFRMSNYAKATEFLRYAVTSYPHTVYLDRCYYYLGTSYFVRRDFKDAIDTYIKLLMECPKSPLVVATRFAIANGYEENGEFLKALNLYNSLVDIYPYPAIIKSRIKAVKGRISNKGRHITFVDSEL